MQNLKKNWLAVWKMTWGIWQIFTRAIESLKLAYWWDPLIQSRKSVSLKSTEKCHGNEEWCKIWRGIDFSFQNWHEEFDKFWPKHFKVSKIFILMCSFWAKYILFELKKYRGVIFHDTEEWCKIWRKTDLWFGKWHEEYGKFSPEHLKVSKLGLWWDHFIQSRKCMSLKFTGEYCVMIMKNDTKFEEDLTCQFKIDMKNLTNFDPSTQKSQSFAL